MDYLKGINIGFRKQIKNGITFYTVPAFEPYVNFAFCGDISNEMVFKAVRGASYEQVRTSFKSLCNALDVPYEACVMTNIVHGDTITEVDSAHKGHGVSLDIKLPPCDGLITDLTDIPIATTHADCMPIAFFDKEHKAGCVIHAGWRGILKGIHKKGIEMLIKNYGAAPENILVSIGPAINKCCFVVDKDVSEAFTDTYCRNDFVIDQGAKDRLDLLNVVIKSVLALGTKADNITVDGRCTCCMENGLESYRRDGNKAGTMVQIMCLK